MKKILTFNINHIIVKIIMKVSIAVLVLFFSPSVFAKWTFLEANSNGYNFYYNNKLIYKDGKYIYFWQLSDYPEKDKSGDMSSIFYSQLDCNTRKYKWLYLKFYDQEMGTGNLNAEFPSNDWQENKSNSIGALIDDYICKNYN